MSTLSLSSLKTFTSKHLHTYRKCRGITCGPYGQWICLILDIDGIRGHILKHMTYDDIQSLRRTVCGNITDNYHRYIRSYMDQKTRRILLWLHFMMNFDTRLCNTLNETELIAQSNWSTPASAALSFQYLFWYSLLPIFPTGLR